VSATQAVCASVCATSRLALLSSPTVVPNKPRGTQHGAGCASLGRMKGSVGSSSAASAVAAVSMTSSVVLNWARWSSHSTAAAEQSLPQWRRLGVCRRRCRWHGGTTRAPPRGPRARTRYRESEHRVHA
jgi:hypothetical protein